MRSFRTKLLLIFATCLGIVAVAGSVSAAWLNRIALKSEIQTKLMSVASAAAVQIDSETHEALASPDQMTDPRSSTPGGGPSPSSGST